MKFKYSIFALLAINANLFSNELINLEQMSVTATKIATYKEVSESIFVVDEKTIEIKIC